MSRLPHCGVQLHGCTPTSYPNQFWYCKVPGTTIRVLSTFLLYAQKRFTVYRGPASVYLYIVRRISPVYLFVLYSCTLTLAMTVYNLYTDIVYNKSFVLKFKYTEGDGVIRIGDIWYDFLRQCYRLMNVYSQLLRSSSLSKLWAEKTP